MSRFYKFDATIELNSVSQSGENDVTAADKIVDVFSELGYDASDVNADKSVDGNGRQSVYLSGTVTLCAGQGEEDAHNFLVKKLKPLKKIIGLKTVATNWWYEERSPDESFVDEL